MICNVKKWLGLAEKSTENYKCACMEQESGRREPYINLCHNVIDMHMYKGHLTMQMMSLTNTV